jgi:hypothetical protein
LTGGFIGKELWKRPLQYGSEFGDEKILLYKSADGHGNAAIHAP